MSNEHLHPIFRTLLAPFMPPEKRQHTESADCWCNPTLDYTNPETGAQHWIHHEPN